MKNTLRYQPTHARAQFFLGRCFERLGQYDDAIAAYKKSLQNDPKNGRTHSYLAYVYRAQKKYQDAQREAQLAQKYGETLDPGFLFLLRYRPTPRSE
jgi:tetratricopeptide (TPR) repeat protein